MCTNLTQRHCKKYQQQQQKKVAEKDECATTTQERAQLMCAQHSCTC